MVSAAYKLSCALDRIETADGGLFVPDDSKVECSFFSKVLNCEEDESGMAVFNDFKPYSTPGTTAGQIVFAKFMLNGLKLGYCSFDCWKIPAESFRKVSFDIWMSSVSSVQDPLKATISLSCYKDAPNHLNVISQGRSADIKTDYIVHNKKVYVRGNEGKYVVDKSALATTCGPQKKRRASDFSAIDLSTIEGGSANFDKKLSNSRAKLSKSDVFGHAEMDIFHASFEEADAPKSQRISTARYKVKVDGLKRFELTGRKRALLIGCNYSGTKNELAGAIDDQTKIAKLLSASYGFQPSEMLILNDKSKSCQRPDKAGILKGIQWLVKDAKAGDCLWFSFSGHGLQIKDKSGDEVDGFDEALMPLDCDSAKTAITDDEVFANLVQGLPEGCKLTCFFDCCHSGSACDLGWYFDANKEEWVEESNAVHCAADVVLISGCMDTQQSQDVTLGKGAKTLKGGALTLSFLSQMIHNWGEHSYLSLVQTMKKSIHANGFTNQSPAISATQSFSMDREWNILGEICPNFNKILGPTAEKKQKLRAQRDACRIQKKKKTRSTPRGGVKLEDEQSDGMDVQITITGSGVRCN